MEGHSLINSGQLQSQWNNHGPPSQFQCYQENGDLRDSWQGQGMPDYRNHYGTTEGGYVAEGAGYRNRYNQYQQQQGIAAKQWHEYSNAQGANRRKHLTCGPCNRTFYSQQKMDEHLNDHVDCPFPECKLSAHIKVIDLHINNQHMLVNFAALQIDDETWIADRKKRFPTAKRAELRRAEQMEKLKRGEKLGISKKPFDHKRDEKNFKRKRHEMQRNNRDNSKETNGGKDEASTSKNNCGSTHSQFRHFKRPERPPGPRKPSLEVDLFESSDEEVYGVKPFKGTKEFYESTGEMNYFSSLRKDENSVEGDIAISDEEEWETEKDENNGTKTLVLGGALGSLMGAYSDSEEENVDAPVKTNVVNENSNAAKLASMPSTKEGDKCPDTKLESKGRPRKRFRAHKRSKNSANAKKFVRPYQPKRRRSLLERLLQADIIHERNIILQCIRYVVENDFFDNGVKVNTDVELEKRTVAVRHNPNIDEKQVEELQVIQCKSVQPGDNKCDVITENVCSKNYEPESNDNEKERTCQNVTSEEVVLGKNSNKLPVTNNPEVDLDSKVVGNNTNILVVEDVIL